MSKLMLAKELHKNKEMKGNPPDGWIESPKWDGYRALWNGEEFISRGEKIFQSPEWYKMSMPKEHLDGELWISRDDFQGMGVVRKKVPNDDEWIPIKFMVYDLPKYKGVFKDRLKELRKIVQENNKRWEKERLKLEPKFHKLKCPLQFTKQTVVKNKEHFKVLYDEELKKGGEGIMLKHPDSLYEGKRSDWLLKVKPSYEEEAIIVDFTLGKGKYEKMLGGFVCRLLKNMDTYHLVDSDEGHEFTLSGMDDEVRKDFEITHPIGTVISFEHSGKTKSGKPRFGRYLRRRDDIIVKTKVDEPSLEKRNNIISILKEISDYEKVNGDNYRSRSYLKVVSSLKRIKDDSELTEINLKKMDGIGPSIYEKIHFILNTGSCPQYENIKKIDDPRYLFMNIHGVGPQCANKLVKNGIQTINELREHKNINELLNETQLIGLKYYEDLLEKIPRNEMIKHEMILKKILNKIDPNSELTISGSYRRGKDFSGDIDVLIKSELRETYSNFIKTLISSEYIVEHLAYGRKKYNGICKLGKRGICRRIDIMNTNVNEYPFSILYFTGSDEFNKIFRMKCLEKGYTINEYGIKKNNTKEIINHEFKNEKDIFDFLNIQYVEPSQRL